MRKDTNDARWPGHIELPDYMNFVTLHSWETAMAKAKLALDTKISSDFYKELLPTAISIVKEWHIEGLPEKVELATFPASANLMSWIIACVTSLYNETQKPPDPKS